MTITAQAPSFGQAAAGYAANRPSCPPCPPCPPVLLPAAEELAGGSSKGARVADAGADSGLATALLHARGAHVIAVEPGPAMASPLRLRLPDVPPVPGDGNRLPPASGSADLLTCARAWHGSEPRTSVPEAVRVLRPGGTLALRRNDPDSTVPRTAGQDARPRRFFGAGTEEPDPMARFRGLPPELGFVHRQMSWTRNVPLDTPLANLAGCLLREVFPDGTVEERYAVSLAVAPP
ncbi:class I SAM-dependent methyltransferase [Streptomyces mirabilis]|uniref:class I SAM-dependent methyltransferase n=1 Tax=Streptomyces mirabilis TaxID=68239 RepID=UPI0033AE42E7